MRRFIRKVDLVNMFRVRERGIREGGAVDYRFNSFCSKCQEKKPIELIRCDYCGRMVRHRPITKKAKRWEKELVYY